MIDRIGQIALTVSDVGRSIAFFRDEVGLQFLFAPAPSLAFFSVGAVRLMLSAPEGEFTPGSSPVIYLQVQDIEAEYATMQKRGVTFIDDPHLIAQMPDHDLWMCFFRDPDGHTFALMSEKPASR